MSSFPPELLIRANTNVHCSSLCEFSIVPWPVRELQKVLAYLAQRYITPFTSSLSCKFVVER